MDRKVNGFQRIVIRDVVKSITKIEALQITVPSDIRIRSGVAKQRFPVFVGADFMPGAVGMDVKRRPITGQNEIVSINEAHVNGRDNGQSVEKTLKRVGHAVVITFSTIFVSIDNIFRFGMSVVDQFFMMCRSGFRRLLEMIFIKEIG